jgi:hypothetical protein
MIGTYADYRRCGKPVLKPAFAGWFDDFERLGDNFWLEFSTLLRSNRGGDGGPNG